MDALQALADLDLGEKFAFEVRAAIGAMGGVREEANARLGNWD